MERVLLVARNVFRGIMSKRAVYIWGAAILLMFLRSAPAIFLTNDNETARTFMRANAVSGSLDFWSLLCIGTAVMLGSGMVANEITTKTIVTLLARPIRRWELMVGKWIGLSAFAFVSLALGVVLGLAIARYLNIDVERRVLAMALAHTAAAILLFGGFAVALGSLGTAVVAVAITVLLMFMPGLIAVLKEDPGRVRRGLGAALDYATPPGFSNLYDGVAWAPFPAPPPGYRGRVPVRQRPQVDYKAERTNVLKNLGYAAVYFAIGCVLFSRRDIKLS